jgi:hypothetical protein
MEGALATWIEYAFVGLCAAALAGVVVLVCGSLVLGLIETCFLSRKRSNRWNRRRIGPLP